MAKSRRANSYDVARIAGVSQSAVSRTFTPGASVSSKTREKVLSAARELGYKPNAIARSLITRRSQIVAVVITELSTLHYPDILIQLGMRLQQLDQHLLLFTVSRENGLESVLPQVLQYQVDGIISCVTMSTGQLALCNEHGVSVALFNRTLENAPAVSVCCDHAAGGAQVAALLYEAGHRRFGFIGGPADGPVSAERERGFMDRLQTLGIADIYKAQADYSYDGGYACTLELMVGATAGKHTAPEAIFCANDTMAMGALDALRYQLGLRVPEDVSVVGFDDISAGARPSYRLTTVRQPLASMTEAVIALLQERINNPDTPPAKRLIPGRLMLRGSARLPQAPD